MKNKILVFVSIVLSTISFGQQADDCADSEAGCDAVVNGFPISPSGFGDVDEANGPNGSNVSWPGSNPQGVNSGCMFSGELNSTWISFTILNDGVLEFSLGQSGGSGFFDWIMWQNTDGFACDGILNNTLAPVSCNWNAASAGFTGMAATGNLPAGANAGNFQPALNVQAGDQFILCFSNYSGLANVIVPLNDNGSAIFACVSPFILDPTICEGETTTLEFTNMPPNITSYSWSPTTNISATNTAIVDVWPTDTTTYTLTLVSPDSTWDETVTVNVVHVNYPNAGLDDSLCHVSGIGYQMQGVLYNDGVFNWEMSQGPLGTPAPPNAVFQPSNTTLTASVLTNYPGMYEFVLHESDTNNVCPETTDTVNIYYSKEHHTTTFTDPLCYGNSDGTIQIQSDGMLGAIEYSFNGGTVYKPLSDTTNLPAGTYTVYSRDYLGCTYSSTVTLTDPPQVILTVGPLPDSTVCENGTGTLYASAINGNSFNFHWNHTTDLNHIQTIMPFADSTVTVFAENDLGCMSDTLPITILVHNPISLVISANDTVCPGYDSQITIEAIGGFQGYDYSWQVNGSSYNEITNIINVNPNVQSTYCVTVSDICETTPKTICTDIIMREVPEPLFVTDTTEGCVPQVIVFDDATIYNLAETQTDSINWLIDGILYTTPNVAHEFENVGDYSIEIEIYTQFGCHASFTANEYISIHEIPEANFYVIPNPTTIFNTEVDMINITQGENLTFEWLNPGGLPASSSNEAPTVTYPEGIAANYPVQLVVTNEFTCSDTATDVVHVISDVLIYAPNAFTPDGDDKNNEWRVYMDGIRTSEYHLLLFNRWGEIIWESYDPEASWDGKYGGQDVKDGTYIWQIIAGDANSDKKYEFKGHVNVLR